MSDLDSVIDSASLTPVFDFHWNDSFRPSPLTAFVNPRSDQDDPAPDRFKDSAKFLALRWVWRHLRFRHLRLASPVQR